jgi:hypothetical protein
MFLVAVEVVYNYIFLALEVPVKRRPAYARLVCDVYNAYLFIPVFRHKLKKRLHDIKLIAIFRAYFHDTKSPFCFKSANIFPIVFQSR